jgi:hypothetical protein
MSDEVVIVRDESRGFNEPGRFALVRVDEWCQYGQKVTLWRGPKKPDEVVETKHLTEVGCKAVHVDKDGFFLCNLADPQELTICPQITDELKDEVEKAAEKAMNVATNQHEAEVRSYVEYESLVEKLGEEWSDKIWAVATFEDGIAVNGEAVSSAGDAEHPDGWVEREEFGGRTDGGETEIYKHDLIYPVSRDVSRELKSDVDENTVRRVLDVIYPKHDYVIWSSDWGDIEVWVSKAANRRLDAIERLEERKKELKRRKKELELQKEEEQRLRRESEERREKIQRGGFPEPRDWSPRGRLPRED